LYEVAKLRTDLHGHEIATAPVICISYQAIEVHRMTPRSDLIGSPIARFMGGVNKE
jgi:hypothetical protein